jgi:hypothetical protein
MQLKAQFAFPKQDETSNEIEDDLQEKSPLESNQDDFKEQSNSAPTDFEEQSYSAPCDVGNDGADQAHSDSCQDEYRNSQSILFSDSRKIDMFIDKHAPSDRLAEVSVYFLQSLVLLTNK